MRATTSGCEIVWPEPIGARRCPTPRTAVRGHEALARDRADRLEHALVGDVRLEPLEQALAGRSGPEGYATIGTRPGGISP